MARGEEGRFISLDDALMRFVGPTGLGRVSVRIVQHSLASTAGERDGHGAAIGAMLSRARSGVPWEYIRAYRKQ